MKDIAQRLGVARSLRYRLFVPDDVGARPLPLVVALQLAQRRLIDDWDGCCRLTACSKMRKKLMECCRVATVQASTAL